MTKPPPESFVRVLQRTGRRQIVTLGRKKRVLGDSYHRLLTIHWPKLFALLITVYLSINTVFALLYLCDPTGVTGIAPGSFADAFFFSVQTLATIGYGVMAPKSGFSHVIVTVEAFVGVLMTAMATGLLFSRFSRPTARVLFSNVAVVNERDGQPTLMFRMANERANQMVEARLQVALLRTQTTREGDVMRRFHDLRLVRSQNIVFALTWTAMHTIDEDSPLYGMTQEELLATDGELIVSLTGIDETMSQVVHARWSYVMHELRWHHRFIDVIGRLPDGRSFIDYSKFHDTAPVASA